MNTNKTVLKYLMRKVAEESGGKPIPQEPTREETKTLKEILREGYYIVYFKDIEKIHSGEDRDPEAKDWPVYKNTLKIKDSLQKNSNLPPVQVIENEHKVVDGAHRLSALNLLMKEDPSWGNFKLKVQYYDKAAWDLWKKETGQPESA